MVDALPQRASRPRLLLVTGTLAAPAMQQVAQQLAQHVEPIVEVLNIQVAALMTTPWVGRKLQLPADQPVDQVVLPGYCRGDLQPLQQQLGVPVVRGPKNLFDLPAWVTGQNDPDPLAESSADNGCHRMEIIAEINHAAHLPLEQILAMATAYRADGADVIDLGCDPHSERPAWLGIREVVRQLRERDFRVSVDSFHPQEVEAACQAGAQLVLSVNSTNRQAARSWGAEVVVIPDDPHNLVGLDETVDFLAAANVPMRLDPIIEPIGMGFAQSLGRYLTVRQRYPQIPMMMGIGNLTELTAVDSAGVNALLVGFCQELDIASVLTTQVINWARSSVREIDAARRLMFQAIQRSTVPKHLDNRLVMLRDARLKPWGEQALQQLAASLRDRNIRLFAETAAGTGGSKGFQRATGGAAGSGLLHAMNRDHHVTGTDPFALFRQLGIDDADHAFYLGYELAKAELALKLGKQYTQDEPLDWGLA